MNRMRGMAGKQAVRNVSAWMTLMRMLIYL